MNFIWTKKNALAHDRCDQIIADAEKCLELGVGLDMHGIVHAKDAGSSTHRDDTQLFIPRVLPEYYAEIQSIVYQGLAEYAHDVAGHLSHNSGIHIGTFKFQKTKKNATGFADFHAEQGAGLMSSRCAVWTLYLNNVTEGGETEFPYQGVRVSPEKGALCIFPASYTHLHRGNPPYSNDKYILTGWFHYPDNQEAQEVFSMVKVQL